MPLRTLGDLLREGALRTAEFYVSGRLNTFNLREALRNRYGAEFQGSIPATRGLLERARAGVEAGRALEVGLPVRASEVPSLPFTATGAKYEYRVVVTIRSDPTRPADQSVSDRIHITVPADRLLQAADVRAAAAEAAKSVQPDERKYPTFLFVRQYAVEPSYDVEILTAYKRA